MRVFDLEGKETGSHSLSLGAGNRISKLLSELAPSTAGQVGGYSLIDSTEPLIAQQVFATHDLSLMSAVPPTVIQ